MMDIVVNCGSGNIPKLPSHKNPGLEIVHLSHGRLRWHAQGKTEILTPDSIFFTLPWEEHGSVEEFEPGHHWQYIIIALDNRYQRPCRHFKFHPSLQFSASEDRHIVKVLTAAKHHCFRAGNMLPWILKAIIQEKRTPSWMSDSSIASLARIAVLELCRQIRADDPASAQVRDRARHAIDRLVGTIAQHSDQAWTLESMAAQCGLRRSQFAELFFKSTGDSPITFINRMRVARARTLLKTTDHTITYIAHACGFTSSQYFARQFLAFSGVGARAYRIANSK